jgi:aspartokinase
VGFSPLNSNFNHISMSTSGLSPWVVHKFGGSSVADAACFQRVAGILMSQPTHRLAVVLSACRGVTDVLLNLVSAAERQDPGVTATLPTFASTCVVRRATASR